jgi:tetratricopeptide (TPR) repeat protein
MLNRALRLMEVDLIIKTGFFIRDLHNHIAELHTEQYVGQHHSDSFIVYRGQGLSSTAFDQLQNTQGGLLAFNNFLSTSKNRNISLSFARQTIHTSALVGVLFVLNIDPSISATPFANVTDVGYYQADEEEILFSMHSVFRIGKVKQIDGNTRLWQADLILTSDNDPQLHDLTKCMKEETSGSTGWDRLGQLVIKLGQFNKAAELYNIILKQTNDDDKKPHLYFMLGTVYRSMGEYSKALEISQKTLPPNHPDLGTSYNNIGGVYKSMGEYPKALSYYEKALEIQQKTLPANHLSIKSVKESIEVVKKKL